MRRNLKTILEGLVFPVEGGYVDHPRDPGGATNMGITIHTMKALELDLDNDGDIDREDVKLVTKDIASDIYEKRYWVPVEGDKAPSGLDAVFLDAAINSGPRASIRWFQRAAGLTPDGILGPITRRAISNANPRLSVLKTIEERLSSVRQFRDYDVFGRGWENRIEHVKTFALALL